ncbi:FtsX-like permease family protein [Amnibacterium endophyticum]|uniref:FtsX-like permease family protein n=1 Tax=Amnibacterium endophyticum TaxID=2109337 RepID=A0ABW4LH44_9MICO
MLRWTLLVAQRGSKQLRGLVALVLAVQVVAVALAAALPALLAATEQAGVRRALADSPDTGLKIVAADPTRSVAETVRGADRAADHLLGPATGARPLVTDVSGFGAPTGPAKARPYLGELPARAFRVSAGSWPASTAADGVVPVAVPRAGATALGVSVGSSLQLGFDSAQVRARVVALYDPVDRSGEVWSVDPLSAAGEDDAHADPDRPYGDPIDVVGPLIVAPGTLDALDVAASGVHVAYRPDFAAATVDGLDALAGRLASIDQVVAVDVGAVADSVSARTRLGAAVDGVLGQLLITRTTAAVAGLLLVVLASTVLVQAALLLDAARADQRALLAARGASRVQLIAVAAWEAVVASAVAVLLGVPLGSVIASLLRAEPTAPTGGSWAAGVAMSVVIVVVRLLPRIRAAERTAGRPARATGLMRTGGDLVLVVLAGVLGWQLLTRRVDTTAGVDPVLVAAPAALVLAGALVALRVLPLVGRLGELLARRSSGPVTALAGWELSRRASRAGASVLLVALAIAAGAFGAVGEATWLRSQHDQAALAVGAPVRVEADQAIAAEQGALLADGAAGTPQPTLRRPADVVAGDSDPTLGPVAALGGATVLGLTGPARAMLDHGRVAEEGGAAIARLRATTRPAVGVALPRAAGALRLVLRAGDERKPVAGAAAQVRAVLEGPDGLLTTVGFGLARLDGRPHALGARVPAERMRLVGFQLQVLVDQPAQYRAGRAGFVDLRLQRLEASGTRLDVPAGWTTTGGTGDLEGGLQVPVEADLQSSPASVAVLGWPPVDGVSGVWTRDLVRDVGAQRDERYQLAFGSVLVPCTVFNVVARVPGSGASPAAGPSPDVVVVDQRALSRFLVQSGDTFSQVDQWWVDVAPARVDAYLAAHATTAAVGDDADGAVALAERLTRGPLRLATTQTLHLLLAAAAGLGLLGFAVGVVASLAARRREMAQLRAIGLRRGVLERLLVIETTVRVAIGALLGLALGVLLGALAAPRLVVGRDGGRPVPSPLVVLPALELTALVAGAVVAAAVAAVLITRTFRGLDPARILREGEG